MPRFAANLSMLFAEHPFLKRYAAAAQAGFSGVECWFPYDHDPTVVAELLETHGLQQVLINAPAGDWITGERGIGCHPARITEFREGIDQAIDYARAVGCRQINVLAGVSPSGVDTETIEGTLLANLRFAAKRMAERGLTLLLEPINTRDIPGYAVNRSAQALAILEAIGVGNTRLQYDCFHMQVMEGNLAQTIERHLERIGHIQVADNPGRGAPGSGEINYGFLFDLLDHIGYPGWVSAEYLPGPDTPASLSWLHAWLERKRLQETPA
jgi:hydroxypyruvate isomerase